MEHFILVNNLGGGGAERQISYIVELPEIKTLYCIESVNMYSVSSNKLVVYSHKKEAGDNLLKKALQFLLIPKWLMSDIKPSTNLICFLNKALIIGYILKCIRGCRFTVTVRTNPWAFYSNSGILKMPFWFYCHILKKADFVVANSFDTAQQINDHLALKHPAIAIPNGYDLQTIDTEAEHLPELYHGLFESSRVLLNVGRLSTDKGQWHLIRIFHALKKKYPDFKLIILGQGPLLEKLCELCDLLHLAHYRYDQPTKYSDNYDVYFLGFKNPYSFMRRSYLFLFPSIFEGLPNSPLEAMCNYTPVLMPDCPTGPREILFPDGLPQSTSSGYYIAETGLLSPPFDGQEVFDAQELTPIEQMWVDGVTYYNDHLALYNRAKEACNKIRSFYSVNETKRRWKQFLNQVEQTDSSPSYK